MKDWTGNSRSVFSILGATSHSDKERQTEDYYATSPEAIDHLAKAFDIPTYIWEPSCGEGHLSERLKELGHEVWSSDLIDRGYGQGGTDFLMQSSLPDERITCILTNPPYRWATDFIEHALTILHDGGFVVMLLKTTALEGKDRYRRLYKTTPPYRVYQFVKRLLCAKNGDFKAMVENGGSSVSYAWFVWKKGYKGQTTIEWI